MKKINAFTMFLLLMGTCMFLQNCKKETAEQPLLLSVATKSDTDPNDHGEEPSDPGSEGNLQLIQVYTPQPFIHAGVWIGGGNTIFRTGIYHLDFQTDGNLVLYKDGPDPVLWASDTNYPNGSIRFTIDGNVQILNSFGIPQVTLVDPSKIGMTNDDNWWVLQADGNFVGYRTSSIDANGQRVYCGVILGSTFTDGGRRSDNYGKFY